VTKELKSKPKRAGGGRRKNIFSMK